MEAPPLVLPSLIGSLITTSLRDLTRGPKPSNYVVHDDISQHRKGTKFKYDLDQMYGSGVGIGDFQSQQTISGYSDPTFDSLHERRRHHIRILRVFLDYRERRSIGRTGYSVSRTEYFVEGKVNGTRVEAFPDSGADMCFISPNLVSRLGLSSTTGTEKMINLANNKLIQSPGMVEVSWKFAKGQEATFLKCWIIPGCVHDLILGSHFLRATETLTKFIHRIKSKLVELPRRLRVRLVGEEKQRLWGSLNGHPTAALPDTGSDIMLISSEYARKNSLVVDRDFENWLEVELADGTTDWTSGVVRDVSWNVGGKTVRCDFHVLDGLSVDVILSKDYLFDLNVFSEHAEWFFDTNEPEHMFQLRNIRLIGRYGDTLNASEEDYLEDITSPEAFGPEMVQKELARRDQIRDEILTLPESEQEEASKAEAERQRQWQGRRQTHRTKWRAGSSTGHKNAHRTEIYRGRAQTSEEPPIEEGARETFKTLVTSGMLWKKKVSVISIPLRSLRKRGSS